MNRDGTGGALGARVTRGAAALVGANLATRVLGALSVVAVARLLSPEDYGVLALAMVVVGLAEVLTNLQFANALVRLPTVEKADLDTAFAMTALRGLVGAAGVLLSADAAAALLGEPRVAEALTIMALAPLLDGLRNPRLALFARNVDFRPEIVVEIGGRVVAVAVTVALAVTIGDFRALAIGPVAGSAAAAALSHLAAPARLGWSLARWRPFLSFGGWLSAAGVVNFLNYRLDAAILGSALGAGAVGRYTMGEQMATIATHQLAYPLTRALYPGLAAVAADRARLRAAHRKAQTTILGLLMPVGVGSALSAVEIVRLLAGPQWSDAAPIVAVLAPVMAFGMIGSSAQAVSMAVGDTRAIFVVGVANLAVRLPLVLIGLWAGGLMGVVYARVGSGLFATLSMLALAGRQTGDSMLAPLTLTWRTMAACAVMAAAVASLGGPADDGTLAAAVSLGTKAATGAAVYVSAHLALWALCSRPDGFERFILGVAAGVLRGRKSSRLN
jgi:PST family polysaccharide transporter